VAVENRLDDLFGADREASRRAEEGDNGQSSLLRGLKSTILSIDWEISDEVLIKLIEDVNKLEDAFRQDKDLVLFLKLIGSLGKYIKKNKVNAHHSAIQLLISTYDSFEKVMGSNDLNDAGKRELLQAQVEKFKELKAQVARKNTAAADKQGKKSAEKTQPTMADPGEDEHIKAEQPAAENSGQAPGPDMSRMSRQEMLAYVLQEIRQSIQAEFKALREELRKSRGL